MVTYATSSSSDPSIRHSADAGASYQEEMCEKLIQLSFVKIVSSKSERGGARLRKNLLILHLLQKARLEQRNRLVTAARNAVIVASQHPEMKNAQAKTPDEVVATKENQMGERQLIDNGERDAQMEISDQTSQQTASSSNVASVETSEVPNNRMAGVESNPDAGADAQKTLDGVSGNGSDQNVLATSNSSPNTAQESNEDRDKTVKRGCLKRKYDSLENSVCTSEWNSPSKMACNIHHRTIESASPSIQQSQPNLSGLFTVLKTAAPLDNSGSEDVVVSPLSRSLSCSSFVELTCES